MRFDQCAADYDSHAAPQRAFAKRVVEFASIIPGSEILELGAGTGILTKIICEDPTIRVLATDVSPAMVNIGRETVPQAQWRVLDAFHETIPATKLQVSSGLLQWAKDPQRALESWRSKLMPGGRMIHAFPCDPCLREWREIVSESPLVWRGEAEWKEVFAKAGLEIRRSIMWVEEHEFRSAHEMLRSLHRSGVTGEARLSPGHLRERLREYDRRNRHSDGVHATWAWLAIEAA